jgi:anti-sigma factor RsiW
MTMHPNDNALHDYVDGAGDAAGRAAIDQHLAACASCRQLVDDLREIKRAVASIELREPPVRVWSRIERAIKLEREHSATGADRSRHSGEPDAAAGSGAAKAGVHKWAPWLAAAAALALATVVGLRLMPGRERATPVAVDAPASRDVQSIESELRLAESHYENAIKGLEQITKADDQALDPKTAATLQKNLAVIDQAISESRAALRVQPTSEPAQQSLIENFKTKIAFLQDTVALINEMRKGNDTGAARIVSGLKQKGD